MTEIAQRSGTAIGSLYRFFPTKDSIAEALVARYGARIDADLLALETRASLLTPQTLADALAAFMRDLGPDRAAALALIESSTAGAQRETINHAMRRRLAAILQRAFPGLNLAAAGVKAAVLQYLLKNFGNAQSGPAPVAGELHALLEIYLTHGIAPAPPSLNAPAIRANSMSR
jgi:AcrR family transcriptional regulator